MYCRALVRRLGDEDVPSRDLKALTEAFAELNSERVMELVRKQLDAKVDPLDIVEAARKGITIVGDKFQKMEYYLSELITSGVMFEDAMRLIEPKLEEGCSIAKRGRIVLGTVKGDIHDIGKNIVGMLFRCSGFEVIDLGIDVSPERFVAEVEAKRPRVLALSALLTTSFGSMKATVEALKNAGLREKVRVIIGGGPVDAKVVEYVGADGFASDAMGALKLVDSLLELKAD